MNDRDFQKEVRRQLAQVSFEVIAIEKLKIRRKVLNRTQSHQRSYTVEERALPTYPTWSVKYKTPHGNQHTLHVIQAPDIPRPTSTLVGIVCNTIPSQQHSVTSAAILQSSILLHGRYGQLRHYSATEMRWDKVQKRD